MNEPKTTALLTLLKRNGWAEDEEPSPPTERLPLERILERIKTLPVYAHTYPFFFNLQSGRMTPLDLVDFAYINALDGCAIHVHDGDKNSPANMNKKDREAFGRYAEDMGITLAIETSHTDAAHIDEATTIALDLGASSIRAYGRYSGRLSEIISIVKKDLEYMANKAEKHNLYFNLEQHEDLKSHEISKLMEENGSKRLGVVFDFGNMINADETPMQAFKTMAPYIRQVHVKGAGCIPDRGGRAQLGVPFKSEDDEIPAERLIYELMLLGDNVPQVNAFILEQEAGYFAPAYRTPTDDADPYIPHREPSETHMPENIKPDRIRLDEKRLAMDMLTKLRALIHEMKCAVRLELDAMDI